MLPVPLRNYIIRFYKSNFKTRRFIPGKSRVPHAQKLFDEQELLALVEASLDGWWTEGRFAEEFEKKFSSFLGVKYVSLVNSGSSANLNALFSLTSKKLNVLPKKALKVGDEVITMATGFPTTVNPIIQVGLTPVFIDHDIETVNVTGKLVNEAISKKTRAIMVAHTLGNPFPFDEIMPIVKKYNLWLIEDCCDALGSQYNGKYAGTYGDIATFSFYPAHQITMGEGGAVVTNNPLVHMAVRQFRDWGRDCWCDTGKDNTCRRRFQWQMGKLPYGYDHKYIYSQIGFNLKLTDMQAALGVAQLKKLPQFIEKRTEHFNKLYNHLKTYEQFFILPTWDTKKAKPCWFGFMIILRDNAPFTRLQITNYLEEHNIATRTLYGGNLLKHPAYLELKNIRVVGSLRNSDKIMNDGFWIGVQPPLTAEMIDYVLRTFDTFVRSYEKSKLSPFSISVIIPIYNASTTLITCLESLKKQSTKFDEIILVDNKSTDNSLLLVNEYKKFHPDIKIRTIEKKETGSVASSYNLGLHIAQGSYVIAMHSDSALPGKDELKKLTEPFHVDQDVVATYSYVLHPIKVWKTYNFWEKCQHARLVDKKIPGMNGKFDCYKKSTLLELNGFDDVNFDKYGDGNDADIYFRLKNKGKVAGTEATVIHLHYLKHDYSLYDWFEKRKNMSITSARLVKMGKTDIRGIASFFMRPAVAVLPFIPGFLLAGISILIYFAFAYTWKMFTYTPNWKDTRIIILPFINIVLVYYESFWFVTTLITHTVKHK